LTITLPDKPMALTILPNLHHVLRLYPFNSNVSIGSSLKTASFTHGGSVLYWHVGHFYIGTNNYYLYL
ncbi:hypothetical protein DOW47_25555, partial [Salmonella enterica subsp. enterica serovar Florida]|nr:hypothetical protein [Salmonella enterica subsp. enterica serovar Florida]